jgi:hypothetical protein
MVVRLMHRANSPMIFSEYCIEWRAMVEDASIKDNYLLERGVPHLMMSSVMIGISNL